MNSKYINWRFLFRVFVVLFSSLLQTYVIQAFIQPSNLLSSGFTGVSLLLNSLTNGFVNTSIAILLLNIPTAILCYKEISPKFTILSCLQFGATSLFLSICHFSPIFQDIMLNLAFGGFLYGISVVLALKADASTGGTDFIALYYSNKLNKSLWQYVFIFNTIILTIFGMTKGWKFAGYSIIFQFISTKTIETFHHRYDRLTLQVTTSHPEEVLKLYTSHYRHGVSCLDGYGGYSHKPFTVLTTVVSSYEVKEIIQLMKKADPKIIVNIFKTEDFVGGFYRKPME